MRRLRYLAAILAGFYLLSVVIFLLLRHSLIYPFDQFADYRVTLPGVSIHQLAATAQDPALEVWIAPPRGDRPVILYFMGNAGNLAYSFPRLTELADAGYGLAAMSYRGGAGQLSEPSEVALSSDARRLHDGLDQLFDAPIPADRRVIYGVSLGTGIAIDLASEVAVAGLILETPFTRLCELSAHHHPILPACLVMWDERYENLTKITQIDAPLLVLHGTADRVIPYELGLTLFDAAVEPKLMITYPGGRHNDLANYGSGADILAFLGGL